LRLGGLSALKKAGKKKYEPSNTECSLNGGWTASSVEYFSVSYKDAAAPSGAPP
jgi:hypothetical protein